MLIDHAWCVGNAGDDATIKLPVRSGTTTDPIKLFNLYLPQYGNTLYNTVIGCRGVSRAFLRFELLENS